MSTPDEILKSLSPLIGGYHKKRVPPPEICINVISFQIWLFWVSMLGFRGCNKIAPEIRDPQQHEGFDDDFFQALTFRLAIDFHDSSEKKQ